MKNGIIAHKLNNTNETSNPTEVPKKSLKIAPVYPIIAETSKCKRICIRAKSIGLKAVIPTIMFSIGYSANWKSKNKTIPSNNNAKYNQIIMAKPIPFALSRVKIELKNANATKMTEIKQPLSNIIKPILSGELTNNGIPAPIKNAKTIAVDNPKNKLNQIFLLLMG